MSKRPSVVSRLMGTGVFNNETPTSPPPLPSEQTNSTNPTNFAQTKSQSSPGIGERMRELDPSECRLWEFADRPEHEAIHAQQLAEEFRNGVGQIHPAVVREISHSDPEYPAIKYEIISGSVRWRAAKLAGKHLKAVVRKLDDKDAITIMLSENNDRKDISEFARALQIGKVWNRRIFESKHEMAQAHRFAQAKLSQYLKVFEHQGELAHLFGDEAYSMGLRTLYEAANNIENDVPVDEQIMPSGETVVEEPTKATVKSLTDRRKEKSFIESKVTKKSSSFVVQAKLDDEQLSIVQNAIKNALAGLGIEED
jgi:ParB family chromosome partitioning protein